MSAACRKRKSLKTLPPSKAAIFSGSPRSSVCVVPHGRTPPTWPQSYWPCVPHSRMYCNQGSSASFPRSEEHTSELQSLMRISYAVFCLNKKKQTNNTSKQLTQHETDNPR